MSNAEASQKLMAVLDGSPAQSDSSNNADVPRREVRKPTSWVGAIRLDNGTQLPCFVKDASKSGLKLSVPSSFALAKHFMVFIEERHLAFEATLTWRRGNFVGVKIEGISRLPGKLRWAPGLEDA